MELPLITNHASVCETTHAKGLQSSIPCLSRLLLCVMCRYMDKGRDCIEQGKLYARLLGALGKAGLRV